MDRLPDDATVSAVFSYDAQTGPQYVDLNGIAAGYGIISIPVTGFLPGDQVQTVGLTIIGDGLATIQLAIDMVQRTAGYYEWTDPASISAHFTITNAQIAAIAAASNCTYSLVIMILRNGVQQIREVQAGKTSARPALPAPPLIVNSIVLTGGPVSGQIGQQAQLTATCYDGLGNVLPSATVVWDSGNSNVATVDANGLVTFVTPGVATISATSQGVTASTTATCTNAGFTSPTDKQVPAYNAGLSTWGPVTLVAAYLSLSVGALLVGGGWPAGGSELAPGAAGGYVRSNGSAYVRTSGVAAADVTAGTFGAGSYVFPSSVTVGNGFTVTVGTSALQAVTATTGVFSSTVSASGFTGPLTGNASTATALATARTLAITGDLAWTSPAFDGSGNVTAAGTLATVNTNVGAFGGASSVPSFTVNAKGLITAASSTAVVAPAGTLTGTTLAANVVGSSLTSVGVLASPHMTGPVIDSGGLTITLGTLAAQAMTGTTGVFSGSVTAASFSGALGHTLTFGTHLTGGSFNGSADVTLGVDATALNTPSTLVARDASGNFAAASITAALVGNASTATALQTARLINGQSFNGTGDITVTAAAGTLTGPTLAVNVLASSLTSVGVLAAPHMTGAVVDSGGFTVIAGTAAMQALTATTGVFSSTLAVAGDFTVATTKFSVAALSGNTVVAGTLAVAGVATFAAVNGTTGNFSGAVAAVGLTSSSGVSVIAGASSLQALALAGDLTINSTRFVVTAASGNTAIAGTLNVTGTTTLAAVTMTSLTIGALTATGLITGNAGLTITAGTSSLQALTATSGVFSGAVSAVGLSSSSGLTVSVGTSSVVALTASGLISGSAGLTISVGTSSLQAVTATTFHATSTSALDGDVTVGARVLFTATASKIVPGATSISLRNTADTVDNWLVTDAGVGTLRSALAIGGALSGATTGGFSGIVTTSGLTVSAAVGKIIPGGTSLSHRNNADSADNLLIADSGAITVRSTISGVTTLTATTLGGTLSTAAQPNVTSVGVLASPHMTAAVVDSGGFTVTSGTSAMQAVTATTVHGTGAATFDNNLTLSSNTAGVFFQAFSGNNGYINVTSANVMHFRAPASGYEWYDTADSTKIASLSNGGALTIASGVIVTAGGITVNTGASAFQAVSATATSDPLVTNAANSSGSIFFRMVAGGFSIGQFELHPTIASTVRFTTGSGQGLIFAKTGTDGLQLDDTGTAGNTRMLLYCVDTGALSRVKTGASGTGPGGSGRMLYV